MEYMQWGESEGNSTFRWMDHRKFARRLNAYRITERIKDEARLGYFFEASLKINESPLVNALDIDFIISALKKAGAEEVKETIICKLNSTEPMWPTSLTLFVKGNINQKRLTELLSN